MRALRYVGIFVFGSLCANSQTLDNLIQIGIEENPEIKASELSYDRSAEEVNGAKYLPNTELGVGYFLSEPETRTGPQKFKVSARQMLPWFGTLKTRSSYMKALSDMKLDDIEIAKRKLALSISFSYYSMWEIRGKQKVLEKNKELLKTYETLALTSVEVGKATAVDVLKLQIRQNELDQLQKILDQYYLSELALMNKFLNRDATREVIIEDSVGIDMAVVDLINKPLGQHPELVRYDNLSKSVEESEALNQIEGRPMIGFGLDYVAVSERNDITLSDNGKDIIMPMMSVSVPIFNNRFGARSKQNAILKEEINYEKQQRFNSLEAELNKAVRERNAAVIRYQTLIENKARAKDAESILIRSYETGTLDFDEILDVQELQLKFQFEEIEAVKTYNEQTAIVKYISQ